MTDEMKKALLEKAGHKSLTSHFKKVASHHEKKAAHHEKMQKAHASMAEHHEALAEGGDKHHKVKHQFHKTMASHHEAAAAQHTKMAEHYHKASEAHASGDAEKIAKAWEFELETLATELASPAVVPPVAAAVPAVVPTSGGEAVNKGAEQKLDTLIELMKQFVEKKTVDPATPPTPVTPATPESAVEKKLDTLIDLMKKSIETPATPAAVVPPATTVATVDLAALSTTLAPGIGRPTMSVPVTDGTIKSFAIPRSGDLSKAAGSDLSNVPAEYADLVGTTHQD